MTLELIKEIVIILILLAFVLGFWAGKVVVDATYRHATRRSIANAAQPRRQDSPVKAEADAM